MPATVLAFQRPVGRTALMWHHLALESKAADRSIVCCRCLRPHTQPPQYGKCPCGNSYFEVQQPPTSPQLRLELDLRSS